VAGGEIGIRPQFPLRIHWIVSEPLYHRWADMPSDSGLCQIPRNGRGAVSVLVEIVAIVDWVQYE